MLYFFDGLLDVLFDWVGWELGTALDVFDGLLDDLFDSVGWELRTAPGVFDGLLDWLSIRMAGSSERRLTFLMEFARAKGKKKEEGRNR